jgi:hypothetical protein
MPGQLAHAATVQQEIRTYAQRKETAKEKIRQKLGEEVIIRQRNEQVVWKVIAESHADVEKDSGNLGFQGTDLDYLNTNEVIGKMFLQLTFSDWTEKLDILNTAIDEKNSANSKSQRVRQFTESEFLTCIGLLVGAPEYGVKGTSLWQNNNNKKMESNWLSIMPHPNFDRYIPEYRFRHFREFLPFIYHDNSIKETDPWWQFSGAVTEFNNNRLRLLKGAKVKAIDESMCAYRPRTTSTGGLPNISFIKRKPEPLGLYLCFVFTFTYFSTNIFILFYFLVLLGTEFKVVACPKTGCLLHLEIQRGKAGMASQKYQQELGATAACTLRLAEECITPEDDRCHSIQGDAWFGSVKAAAALGRKGFRAVLQVKNNKGLFPKDYVEKALEDAPGGVHIVLKGTAPNGIELLALGYRYSTKTTLFFVATADAGSTRPGKEYEMKYTDDHGNVCVRLVERPDIISNFFADSNTIDKHNQARQFDLALEKTWLTQDPYFRLATTLIGMNVVDTWKLADHHKLLNPPGTNEEAKVTIKRFAGMLCYQFVTNTSAFTSAPSRPSRMLAEISLGTSINTPGISDLTTTITDNKENLHVPIRSFKDNNGLLHHQVRYPVGVSKKGKRRSMTRECKLCKETAKKHLVGNYCLTCGESSAYCCPNLYNDRDCFKMHVERIQRCSNRRRV